MVGKNLIVFEGINGCGKGTQLIKFSDYLFDDRENLLYLTREPNNLDEYGKKAREILKRNGNPLSNQREALEYFSKNRINHNQIFNPLIEKGIKIISDRYYHSTFAFQHAQGLTYEEIANMNDNPAIRIPDLTFIIDIPVETAFERLSIRDGENRRKFDSNKDFVDEVRNNYLQLSKILPMLLGDENIVIVNGTGDVEEIHKKIISIYNE